MSPTPTIDSQRRLRRVRLGAVVVALVVTGLATVERGLSAEPKGCGSCHVMRRYVDGYTKGKDLDAAHAHAAVSCTDCHQGYTLPVRAATGLAYAVGAAGLPGSRRYGDAMCNRCHVGMEHLAAKTDFLPRNPHRSHWPELGCADCHPAHAPQFDFCNQCHDNGGQRLTGEPLGPRLLNLPVRWGDPSCVP